MIDKAQQQSTPLCCSLRRAPGVGIDHRWAPADANVLLKRSPPSSTATLPFLPVVCRGAFLLSSHRCCLVISISSGHAVNDLKRVVSPWKRIRREKGVESRQAPRRIPSNFLPVVCRGASLVSSHRRCLVVSISSGHAVNDLKRVVSPWKRLRREKGEAAATAAGASGVKL
jgi:hypothetical protein